MMNRMATPTALCGGCCLFRRYCCACGVNSSLLSGFNIFALSIEGILAFEAAYFSMSLLPITPAGIGVREGSRIYFFSLIGCSQSAVLCASVIMFGLNIMLPALLGVGSLQQFWKQEIEFS